MKEKAFDLVGRAWVCGVIVCNASISLWQDWLGKDEYIALASKHWTEAKVSVPVAIVVLILAMSWFAWIAFSAVGADEDRR